MKFIKKLVLLILIQVMVLSTIIPVSAASGRAYLSVSSSSVQVGSKVSVTLTVSMDPFLFGVAIYNVTASANLRLVDGSSSSALYGEGSSKSKSITLTYEAISEGTANITATVSDIPPVTWDDEEISIADQGVTINVTSATNGNNSNSNTNNNTNNQPETNKSSNNYLSSLAVDGVNLTPEFNKDTTSYNVSLPDGTTSMKISATAEDGSASISGIGELEVHPGNNTLNVDVTAEDGSVKTYSIFATVKQAPLFSFESGGLAYGVVNDRSQVVIPENFTESTIKIDGNETPCYINETMGVTLLYLSSEEDINSLYIYNETDKSVYKYMVISHANQIFVSLPLSKDLLERKGFVATELELQGNIIQVLQYEEDNALANDIYILYLISTSGQKLLYSYDKAENTLQRYYNSGDINLTELTELQTQQNKDLKSKMMITNIFIGTTVVACLLLLFMFLKYRKIKTSSKHSEYQDDYEEEVSYRVMENVETDIEIKDEQ